jgi:hypothetical protein
MKRLIGRVLIGVILALAAVYAGDWLIWKARVLRGGGMGTVKVGELIITPLKGNKEEYDWGGTVDVDCSRSLFPHAGSGACWWLARRKVMYEG